MTFLRAATNGILGATLLAVVHVVLDLATFTVVDTPTIVIACGAYAAGVFVALLWGPLV